MVVLASCLWGQASWWLLWLCSYQVCKCLWCKFHRKNQLLVSYVVTSHSSNAHYNFLAVSSKVVKAWSWLLWFCFLPTIIMSSTITITCLILPKHWSSLCWKTSPATVIPNGITVCLNLSSSVLKAVRKDEASSSSWCQYPLLQSHRDMIHASASRWAMSSDVLKW